MNTHPSPLRCPGSVLLLSDMESLTGKGAKTLRTYVRQGLLPRPRQVGSALFWDREEVESALLCAPAAARWQGPKAATLDIDSQEVEAA